MMNIDDQFSLGHDFLFTPYLSTILGTELPYGTLVLGSRGYGECRVKNDGFGSSKVAGRGTRTVKKINPKKVLLGAMLALVMTSAFGCVVADRPYYNEPYRRYDYVRPYDRYWNYSNRDHNRWHRQHHRWDRD